MKTVNEFKGNSEVTGFELNNERTAKIRSKDNCFNNRKRTLPDFSKIVESGKIIVGGTPVKPFKSYLH